MKHLFLKSKKIFGKLCQSSQKPLLVYVYQAIHTIHSKQTHLLPFNAFLIWNILNTQNPEAAYLYFK